MPGDAHHHQQVAHQLTDQPGHQQVQWARAWGNKEKEIISRVSDLEIEIEGSDQTAGS